MNKLEQYQMDQDKKNELLKKKVAQSALGSQGQGMLTSGMGEVFGANTQEGVNFRPEKVSFENLEEDPEMAARKKALLQLAGY